MPLRTIKPVTPGSREKIVLIREGISKKERPEKGLVIRIKKNAGRNNQGKITVRHRGGGARKQHRIIDFKGTDKMNIPAYVKKIEYDPARTAFIMLLFYKDGEKRYQLAPSGIKIGDTIVTGEKTKMKRGNRMKLKNIPTGFDIYNIELNQGEGGKLVRGAGLAAKLAGFEEKYAQIQMPSGELRKIHQECFASIGRLGNEDQINVRLGKAGRRRHIGWRPVVTGKAMNPCDHPHGGGEGHCPIGLIHPKTPWGKPALGKKTRRNKRTAKYIIKRIT